ncbi:MAG: hypothetical protein ABIA75_04010 [Candidatus Neomarinimicrobiota bacterium]
MEKMKPTRIAYDDFADVLYITFGKAKSSIVDPITDSDLIRVNTTTHEVVGITLIAYKRRYKSDPPKSYTSDIRQIVDNLLAEHRVLFAN